MRAVKLVVVLFCMVIFVSSVFAASSSGSTGTFLYGLKCDDTGTLKFFQKPMTNPVQVIYKNSGKVMDVVGSWQGTTFTSDEMVFKEAGEYEVVDVKNGNKKVSCPGLEFSCKQAALDVQKCVRKGKKLELYFTVDKVDVGDLKFEFGMEGNEPNTFLTYGGNDFSPELKELQIRTLTPVGRYVLEADVNSEISNVQISHPSCVGKYYIYSKGKCITDDEVLMEKEKKGKELKCGGYLNIKDRVNCRLLLSEEQREEEDNSYPEECKVRKDKDKCLNSYEALRSCRKLDSEQERAECTREKVDINSIAERKKYCGSLKYDDKENCELRLREKVHSLVKFRFSVLEDKAEKLLDRGYLTVEDVSAFELKIEELKVDFNNAKSNAERKEVVFAVREEWKILLGKVKQ